MTRIAVRHPAGKTRVTLGEGALGGLAAALGGRRAVLVADRSVLDLGPACGVPATANLGMVMLPAGEKAKTLAIASRAWTAFARLGVRRDDVVLALGGGAALDAAGFLASTWMRGVPWIALPTTLVAQADACIGGKTALDLEQGKNLVGTFHPPEAVLADPRFLASVPERDFRAGLFELLKCGWIGDPALARLARSGEVAGREVGALGEAIGRALRLKGALVDQDERDRGARRLLNLGHSFGHALEAASGFRGLRHGEAVGVGLLAAAHAARARGLVGWRRFARLRLEVQALGPPRIDPGLVSAAMRAALADKKRRGGDGGALVLVLPTDRGVTVLPGIAPAEFRAALAAALRDLA